MRTNFEEIFGTPWFGGFAWNPPTTAHEDEFIHGIFSRLGTLPTEYTHELTDAYYRYEPCPGAKLLNEVNELVGKPHRWSWSLNPTALPLSPPEFQIHGKTKTWPRSHCSAPADLQVLGLEMIGNGDAEKDDDYGGWFNEQKWGNIAIFVSPGTCADFSPPIPATGSDPFRRELACLAQEQDRTEFIPLNRGERPSDNFVKSRLPGPYKSVYPFPISPIFLPPKCEFGMLWQSVDYDPPLPLINIADPQLSFHENNDLCIRLLEDDRDGDTLLLQFNLNVAEQILAGGTMVYAHHSGRPHSVLKGTNITQASLIKIALSLLF